MRDKRYIILHATLLIKNHMIVYFYGYDVIKINLLHY